MALGEWLTRLGGDRKPDTKKLFHKAWARLNSPGRTIGDCIEVYAHAGIGTFYGSPEYTSRRATWAQIFGELMTGKDQGGFDEVVQQIIDSISQSDKRVVMINLLYEENAKKDTTWIAELFGKIAAYHRSDAVSEPDFTLFKRATRQASYIPSDIVNTYVPEIEQERQAQTASAFVQHTSFEEIFAAKEVPPSSEE